MKYRLIAFDMDNTLLDSKKNVSPRAVSDIQRAAANRCEVVISSGRSFAECEKYVRMLPEIRYLVCDSGSTVLDAAEGKWILADSFTREETELVCDASRGLSFAVTVHVGGKLCADKKVRGNMQYYEISCYQNLFEETAEWIDEPLQYALTRDDVNKLDFFFHDLRDKKILESRLAGLNATLTGGTRTNMEIVPNLDTKGKALSILCEYLNIPMSRTVACGDSYNDLSMIRIAGLGIAVGNSVAELKEAADFVVSDCDHDGAAEALERFILADM